MFKKIIYAKKINALQYIFKWQSFLRGTVHYLIGNIYVTNYIITGIHLFRHDNEIFFRRRFH